MTDRDPGHARMTRRRRQDQDGLGRVPALDGLRAVAVIAVLAFHARFEWIPGGFLGVSTFFTLSGFLITTLLLQEWRRDEQISLRGFFTRRFRRLLPASWLTLGIVLLMGAVGIWSSDQLRSLRLDVPWSLAELVNWHFIFDDRSYGDQFAAPSPLEHFWSLAIEQQFYLILPVAALGVLRWSRNRGFSGRSTLGIVLGVALIASAALNGFFAAESVPRAYFGTDTRLAELAAGGILACVGVVRLRDLGARFPRTVAWLGAIGVAGSLLLWNTATVNSQWLYPWGLLLTAASTTILITAVLSKGWLTSVLSVRPALWLGRISYGVYLLHWPIFLWLTPSRTGLSQWPLFGFRIAVTLPAAALMFRFFEFPISQRRWIRKGYGKRIALPAAAIILVMTLVVTSDLPEASQLASAESAQSTTIPPAPTRVLFVGDQLTNGLDLELTGTPEAPIETSVATAENCGSALGGWVQLSSGTVERDVARCGPVKDLWKATAAQQKPEVVVVWTAVRDVANRRLDVEQPWSSIGDSTLDDFLRVELQQLLTDLQASGAAVMVANVPHMNYTGPAPDPVEPTLSEDPERAKYGKVLNDNAAKDAPVAETAENSAARVDRWNQLIAEAAPKLGIEVLDAAGAIQSFPGGEFDENLRGEDGIGLSAEGAQEFGRMIADDLAQAEPAPPEVEGTASDALSVELPAAPPASPRRTTTGNADILVVGDSVAFNLGIGLASWANNQSGVTVQNAGRLGCPLARGGQYRFLREIESFAGDCEWSNRYAELLSERDPEVVVLSSGIWELVDRRLLGDDTWRHLGEPEMDQYLLSELLSAIDLLSSRGATVVLSTYPHFEAGRDQGFQGLPESDPARVDRLNELIRSAAELRPGVVTLIDFQGWLASQEGGELDPEKRTDGLHFTDEYAEVIGDWLGPQVLDIARNGPPPTG